VAHPKATQKTHFHAVQFYRDEDSLIKVVADFLAEGLALGEPGIVVATPEHRRAIEEALAARRLDVKRMTQLGDLTVLDAHETLDSLLVDGMPHPHVFEHLAGKLLDETARIHPGRPIRAWGEMVDLLWKARRTAAALRLEGLWNDIARTYDLKMLCGYSIYNVYRDATAGAITRLHSHLIVDNGEAATIN
jgi:hypothetical protein